MIHSWNYNEYWIKCEYSISNLKVNLKEQNMLFNLVNILKILTMRKGSHQTIIFGQILAVLNLTIWIKCYKQEKNMVDCRDHNSKKSNVI